MRWPSYPTRVAKVREQRGRSPPFWPTRPIISAPTATSASMACRPWAGVRATMTTGVARYLGGLRRGEIAAARPDSEKSPGPGLTLAAQPPRALRAVPKAASVAGIPDSPMATRMA